MNTYAEQPLNIDQLPPSPERATIQEQLSDKAWAGSEAMNMVESRHMEGMSRVAIITDIDNTFSRSWDGQKADYSREIAQTAEVAHTPIIFITGNDIGHWDEEEGKYTSILGRIEGHKVALDKVLPPAQVIVGAVGTEIAVLHRGPNGELIYVRDEKFDKLMSEQPYNRHNISLQAARLIEQLTEEERELPQHQQHQLQFQNVAGEQALAAGDASKVQPYKCSLHFFANSPAERQQFEQYMRQQFPDQKILTCEEIGYINGMQPGDTYKKYCLDIAAMSKAGAADYVIDQLQLEGGVLAGDSGNDDHLYGDLNPNFVRILVGDAREEAKTAIDTMSADRKTGHNLTPEQANKIGFRTLQINGVESPVLAYKEPGQNTNQHERIGPQSLLYALEALQRWETRRRLGQPEHIEHQAES